MNHDPILDIQREWLDRLRLPADPVIVDVGANEGRFAEEVLKRWPTAHVICFEPQPVAAARAAARNTGKTCEVRNVALGERRETLKLYCGAGGADMSATLHKPAGWDGGIDVPVERLDEQGFLHAVPRIHLLKIDAEGNELPVMRGCGDLLRRSFIEMIQWEHNDFQQKAGFVYAEAAKLLEGRGYLVQELMHRADGGLIPPRTAILDLGGHHELVAS